MTDRQPDANPDSPPREDDRGSIESVGGPATGRENEESPDARNGAAGGTDGETKNQGDAAQ